MPKPRPPATYDLDARRAHSRLNHLKYLPDGKTPKLNSSLGCPDEGRLRRFRSVPSGKSRRLGHEQQRVGTGGLGTLQRFHASSPIAPYLKPDSSQATAKPAKRRSISICTSEAPGRPTRWTGRSGAATSRLVAPAKRTRRGRTASTSTFAGVFHLFLFGSRYLGTRSSSRTSPRAATACTTSCRRLRESPFFAPIRARVGVRQIKRHRRGVHAAFDVSRRRPFDLKWA